MREAQRDEKRLECRCTVITFAQAKMFSLSYPVSLFNSLFTKIWTLDVSFSPVGVCVHIHTDTESAVASSEGPSAQLRLSSSREHREGHLLPAPLLSSVYFFLTRGQ